MNGGYCGIGAGQMCDEPRLLPCSIGKLRSVRLFKKVRDTDTIWIEQPRYQKTLDVAEFCSHLEHVTPYMYMASTIPSQCAKVYWGARAQQIKDQMKKHVPARYVPNEYEVASSGFTGLIRCGNVTSRGTGHERNRAEEAAPTRYNKDIHDKILIRLCPKNRAGKPMPDGRRKDRPDSYFGKENRSTLTTHCSQKCNEEARAKENVVSSSMNTRCSVSKQVINWPLGSDAPMLQWCTLTFN